MKNIWLAETIKAIIVNFANSKGVNVVDVVKPMRKLIPIKDDSVSVYKLLEKIGKEETVKILDMLSKDDTLKEARPANA